MVLLGVLLFSPCPATAESWITLDAEYEYDKDSIIRKGDIVQFWYKRELKSPYTLYDKLVSHTLTSLEINCANRTSNELTAYYQFSDGSRRQFYSNTTQKFEPLPPGPLIDKTYTAVCRRWYEFWK